MECQCIPPAEVPHATPLYSAYLSHFSRVSEFYVHPPDLSGISNASKQVHLEDSIRSGVVEVLRKQNADYDAAYVASQSSADLAAQTKYYNQLQQIQNSQEYST